MSKSNKKLNQNKKDKNDEFYTSPSLVGHIMEGTHKKLTEMYPGKKLHYIFAADGDHSEFVKFGKANNLDFDYGMRFEDFPKYIKNEPNTIYMVVTNPPFSKMNKFLNPKKYPDIDKALHQPNVHHGFVNGLTNMASSQTRKYAINDHVYEIRGKDAIYTQPDGKPPKKLDNTVYFSDLDIDWPDKYSHYQGKRPTNAVKNPDNSYTTSVNWIRHKAYMEQNGYYLAEMLPKEKDPDPKTGKAPFQKMLWRPNYGHPNYDPNKDFTKPQSSQDLEIIPHKKQPKKSKYVVELDEPQDNNKLPKI